MNLKLRIWLEQKTYEYIDSRGDLTSECLYRVIEILEIKWNFKIEVKSKNQINEIILSKEQMDNLNLFLQKKINIWGNIPTIQCLEFCNIINSVKSFDEYTKKHISINEISKIKKWESLVICEISNKKSNLQINKNTYIKKPFFHFAIYIWKGLFLSKFWKWNIYITTFREMHKIYNYSDFYLLTKN